MNLNTVDEGVIKENIHQYQLATGRRKNIIYERSIYPYLCAIIKLHIYNVPADEREDAQQNIHIALLSRLNTINPYKIQSTNDYFFIMVKRLTFNELDKLKVQSNRKLLGISAAEIVERNVFIYSEQQEEI